MAWSCASLKVFRPNLFKARLGLRAFGAPGFQRGNRRTRLLGSLTCVPQVYVMSKWCLEDYGTMEGNTEEDRNVAPT